MQLNNQLIRNALTLFGMLFLLSIPIVWLSLFFTNYQGDLTRIGTWSEYDFSLQTTQPSINQDLLISTPIQEADILVIGDSFSNPLYWQSSLSKNYRKISTIHWSQIGSICENFSQILKEKGFRGTQIIIESVERNIKKQLEKSSSCKYSNQFPSDTAYQTKPFANANYEWRLNLQGQFIAGSQTIFHSLAIRWLDLYPQIHNFKSKSTHIYKLKNGCRYFSNRLCNYGLFFHEDYKSEPLDQTLLPYINSINKRLQTYQVTWLIIPNKSSIYQREVSGDLWDQLEMRRLGPNLYKVMHENKTVIKDIYSPNDTHLSPSGYQLVGENIARFIK